MNEQILPAESISLCMIVRDEERFIADCLRSVFPIIDEMVIVDTGSRDRTVEIARSFGARVLSLPWRDDFAAARNFALDNARGEFCLHLDADETLQGGDGPVILDAKRRSSAAGFHLSIISDHGSHRSRSVQLRLFRIDSEVRFEGRVHEQIAPSLLRFAQNRGMTLETLPADILHRGYLPELIRQRNKLQERKRLLEAQLRDHPGDLYTRFKYTELQNALGLREEALRNADELELLRVKDTESASRIPSLSELPALRALLNFELGRFSRARSIIDDTANPNQSCLLMFVKGMIDHREGRADEAIFAFSRCLEFEGKPSLIAHREGLSGSLALTGLGLVEASRGRFEPAREFFQRALDRDPHCQQALTAYITLCGGITDDSKEDARRRVMEFASTALDPDTLRRAASWMLSLGAPDRARDLQRRSYALAQ